MSSNPLRDLQGLARDIRKIGWSRIPINIERACLLILDVNAYQTNAPYLAAIRFAKLARWASCEVYFICEPSVSEFVDALHHFSTQTLNLLTIFYAGNPISQEFLDKDPALKCVNGTVGPSLVYQTLNDKQDDLRIIFMMDGVNDPIAWDPEDQELDAPGIMFMAPYPDSKQAHLQQFDLKNESLFLQELYTALKANPRLTGGEVATIVQKEIVEFGQKVFVSSHPIEFMQDLALIL